MKFNLGGQVHNACGGECVHTGCIEYTRAHLHSISPNSASGRELVAFEQVQRKGRIGIVSIIPDELSKEDTSSPQLLPH